MSKEELLALKRIVDEIFSHYCDDNKARILVALISLEK